MTPQEFKFFYNLAENEGPFLERFYNRVNKLSIPESEKIKLINDLIFYVSAFYLCDHVSRMIRTYEFKVFERALKYWKSYDYSDDLLQSLFAFQLHTEREITIPLLVCVANLN